MSDRNFLLYRKNKILCISYVMTHFTSGSPPETSLHFQRHFFTFYNKYKKSAVYFLLSIFIFSCVLVFFFKMRSCLRVQTKVKIGAGTWSLRPRFAWFDHLGPVMATHRESIKQLSIALRMSYSIKDWPAYCTILQRIKISTPAYLHTVLICECNKQKKRMDESKTKFYSY